jgi:hypothetical protein
MRKWNWKATGKFHQRMMFSGRFLRYHHAWAAMGYSRLRPSDYTAPFKEGALKVYLWCPRCKIVFPNLFALFWKRHYTNSFYVSPSISGFEWLWIDFLHEIIVSISKQNRHMHMLRVIFEITISYFQKPHEVVTWWYIVWRMSLFRLCLQTLL